MTDMFDMALESLEGVLSQRAARSCLEAGLSVQGKTVDNASLEDYRAALRSNVFRQLQVVMPATAAAQLIREVEFQLEQIDNERLESVARQAQTRPVASLASSFEDGKATAIRDPDLLAMASSNLLTLNLRTLGSLSVEFGDVLFAERDLKLEVRSLRRMLDEGQNVDRARIESLRETLKSRREALLEEQQAQLVALDTQVYELSQRVVVPRELEARLESARRLLASSTLATSDIRQMERLVESVMVPAEVVAQPEPVVSAEPEPVLVASPEPVLVASPEPVLEASPEPVLVASPEPVLEASPEPALETGPEPALGSETSLEPLPDFEPEPAPAFDASPERPVFVASAELAAPPESVQPETAHLETDVFSQPEPQNWDTDEPELVQSGPSDEMDSQPEDVLPDLPLMVDEPVDDLGFEPVAVVKDLAPPMADPVVLIEPSPTVTASPFRFEQRDYPTTPEWRTPEPTVSETALQTEETESEKTVQIGSDAGEVKAFETESADLEPADVESVGRASVAAVVLEPEVPFEPVTVAADEVETTEDLQPDAPELAAGSTELVIPEPAVALEPEQHDVLPESEQRDVLLEPEQHDVLEATTESELDTVAHPEPEVGMEAETVEVVADEPEIVPIADEVRESALLEARAEHALEAEVEPALETDGIKTVPDEVFATELVEDGMDSLETEPVGLEADSTETVAAEPAHHEAEYEEIERELVVAPQPAAALEPEPMMAPETAFEAEPEPVSVSTLEAELAEILESEHAVREATEAETGEAEPQSEVPELIEGQLAETAAMVEPEPLEAAEAEAEALEASEVDADTSEEAESETSEPEPESETSEPEAVVASEWETIHAAAALGEPEMLEAESSRMETHEAEPSGVEPLEAEPREAESLESESLEPEVLGAAEPEMAEPEQHEPEQHEPEQHEPESLEPESHEVESHEVESHEVESHEEETLEAESFEAAEQMEPEQAGPATLEATEPEWHDAEPEASEPEPEQIQASEPESVAPEPEANQPDTDEEIAPEPAVVLEPEMPVVSPVPPIEPDRSSWYAPSFQAAAFTPSAAFDATPNVSALMPSDSNAVPEREEIQVENEIMDSPAAPAAPAAGEEGIVWLATARRDASSRNADRLRKDPMALKPGRLESEHALAEAEAQVLEAKLHAACDGAGVQHRRLEAEFGLKVAQAAVELASKRVEAVGLRERYGAASRAELEHAQLELERSEEELKLARLSEGVAPNIHAGTEPVVNRVEVDAERLKIALQSTPQMLSARHALERAELELAIRDNPAYPASEIASVRNIVNQAREHFSTLEATLHSELEAALASLRYYGARLNERDGAWKSAENELHHAEEGVKQGFVASLTRDEAHLKALRADAERRKAAHKYLEAVHRLQCLTHQHMLS